MLPKIKKLRKSDGQQNYKTKEKIFYTLIGSFFGLLVVIVPLILTSLLPISESYIRQNGERPLTPEIISSKRIKNKDTFHIKQNVIFHNYGFKKGFIKNVEVEQVGLNKKQDVEIIHINKEPINFLSTKKREVEYIISVPNVDTLTEYRFISYFYDDNDNQIYYETIFVIQNIPPKGK